MVLAGQACKPALFQIVNTQFLTVALQRFDKMPAGPVVFGLRQLPESFYPVIVQVEGRCSRVVRLVMAKE